jgi:hypothetical protein
LFRRQSRIWKLKGNKRRDAKQSQNVKGEMLGKRRIWLHVRRT